MIQEITVMLVNNQMRVSVDDDKQQLKFRFVMPKNPFLVPSTPPPPVLVLSIFGYPDGFWAIDIEGPGESYISAHTCVAAIKERGAVEAVDVGTVVIDDAPLLVPDVSTDKVIQANAPDFQKTIVKRAFEAGWLSGYELCKADNQSEDNTRHTRSPMGAWKKYEEVLDKEEAADMMERIKLSSNYTKPEPAKTLTYEQKFKDFIEHFDNEADFREAVYIGFSQQEQALEPAKIEMPNDIPNPTSGGELLAQAGMKDIGDQFAKGIAQKVDKEVGGM